MMHGHLNIRFYRDIKLHCFAATQDK